MFARFFTRGISSGTPYLLEYWAAWLTMLALFIRYRPKISLPAISEGKAVALCALLPVILRLLLLPWMPPPEPAIQEEFSYLLGSDTFASGRLANPPHPMAASFETYQELQQPTYCSIRPPGQALFLAVGKRLTGSDWGGVILSMSLLCGALCWMLAGWMPVPWALVGGLLAVIRLGVLSYWMNSYWGGAVSALGGALVLGALPRLKSNPRVAMALVLSAGIVLTALTRIYEGSFILLPVAVDLSIWLLASRQPGRWVRAAAPVTAMLVLLAAGMAYYNLRTTGSAVTAPYTLYRAHYNSAPTFRWQAPEPRTFKVAEMKRFYLGWEIPYYKRIVAPNTVWPEARYKLMEFWRFYIGPAFTPALLLIPWMRRRDFRILWVILAVALVGAWLETWGASYYFAALTSVVYLLVVEGLRKLWEFRPAAAMWIVTVCAGMFVLSVGLHVIGIRIRDPVLFFLDAGRDNIMQARADAEHKLEAEPGMHLAIVRYASDHNVHEEWVWNRADIDRSKVVWARDLGPAKNAQLLRYFAGRTVWLITPDEALKMHRSVPSEVGVAQ